MRVITRSSLLYIQTEVKSGSKVATKLLDYLNTFDVIDMKEYYILIDRKK